MDYYRRTEKEKTVWLNLTRKGYSFAISTITKYEIYAGATPVQLTFWDSVLKAISVLPFNEDAVDTAVSINNILKRKRKQIDMADLFIAATAVSNNLSLATLNRKHFERIDNLDLLQQH